MGAVDHSRAHDDRSELAGDGARSRTATRTESGGKGVFGGHSGVSDFEASRAPIDLGFGGRGGLGLNIPGKILREKRQPTDMSATAGCVV